MADAQVSFKVRLDDQASGAIARLAKYMRGREAQNAKFTARLQRRGWADQQRVMQARQRLGVRSEQRIQREILQTQLAYDRLSRKGRMSANDQIRAWDAMRNKVLGLRNELGQLSKAQQRMARIGKGVRIGGAAALGIGAGAAMLRAPVTRALNVDDRLADLANTAFAERDAKGRILGKEALREAVDGAVKQYGGTREDAMDALQTLVSRGPFTVGEAIKALPQIVKASTSAGSDASTQEMADFAIAAIENLGIAKEDMMGAFNMGLKGGQLGGFELKDMARYFASQTSKASEQLGMRGAKALATLIGLNQAARLASGSTSEAATNVSNFLKTINSPRTKKRVEEVIKKQYNKDFDYTKYLTESLRQGVGTADAFFNLVDQLSGKNPEYIKLQKELEGAKRKSAEEKKALQAMQKLLWGGLLGEIVEDEQAQMGIIAGAMKRKYWHNIKAAALRSNVNQGGGISENFYVKKYGAGYKTTRAGELVKAGQDKALAEAGGPIGAVADAVGDLAAEFPALTGGVTLATTAVAGMGAAAGVAAIALRGVGRGGGYTPKPYPGNRYTQPGFEASRARHNAWRERFIKAKPAAVRGGALGGAAMLGGMALQAAAGEDSALADYGSSALNGAAIGATIGSMVPVLGTALGGAIGGVGGLLYELVSADAKTKKPTEVNTNTKIQVGLADGLQVQSQSVDSSHAGQVQVDVGNLVEMP